MCMAINRYGASRCFLLDMTSCIQKSGEKRSDIVINPLYQSPASVFNKVKSCLKIALRAIIRVGNGGVMAVTSKKICHADNLPAFAVVTCKRAQRPHIVVVHCHDEVETAEVLTAYLPCMAVETVSAAGSAPAHAYVGQLSGVPCPYAGGTDDKILFCINIAEHLLHNALGGWRAADVSEAYKEYFPYVLAVPK